MLRSTASRRTVLAATATGAILLGAPARALATTPAPDPDELQLAGVQHRGQRRWLRLRYDPAGGPEQGTPVTLRTSSAKPLPVVVASKIGRAHV